MKSGLGPIEVLTISFPGSRFNGKIIEHVRSLTDQNIINVVDGLLVKKNEAGDIELVEFQQPDLEEDVAPLATLFGDAVYDLISEDDVAELAAGVEPGSSAAVMVFEHEWAKALRNSIVDSGGVVVSDLRVPGPVADEVLAALDEPTESGGTEEM